MRFILKNDGHEKRSSSSDDGFFKEKGSDHLMESGSLPAS